MNELRKKIENLVKELDNDLRIIRVKDVNERVFLDKDLCSLIEKYKVFFNRDVKELIDDNHLYLEYLDSERDVNLLIDEINDKLKVISVEKDCSKCGGCSESN